MPQRSELRWRKSLSGIEQPPRAVSRLSWRCSGQLQICQLIGFLHPAVFTGKLVTSRRLSLANNVSGVFRWDEKVDPDQS
jgi:hypothetical protein